MVQPGNNPETRTYSDYESVNDCMEGVCRIYEEHLKRRNPNTPTITYDISQLFDFVDQVNLFHLKYFMVKKEPWDQLRGSFVFCTNFELCLSF